MQINLPISICGLSFRFSLVPSSVHQALTVPLARITVLISDGQAGLLVLVAEPRQVGLLAQQVGGMDVFRGDRGTVLSYQLSEWAVRPPAAALACGPCRVRTGIFGIAPGRTHHAAGSAMLRLAHCRRIVGQGHQWRPSRSPLPASTAGHPL